MVLSFTGVVVKVERTGRFFSLEVCVYSILFS